MMKFTTPVEFPHSRISICLSDKVMVLGSCFADNIGKILIDSGFEVCVNPFGTLYNPISIVQAMQRLASGEHFSQEDCVEMGAGAGRICSFSHHSSFARTNSEDFLYNANAVLDEAASFWKNCNKVIVTLGTIYCWHRKDNGDVVTNCLKRPAAEFSRSQMSIQDIETHLSKMLLISGDRQFVFSVSPIRHMADGAHANQLSKSALLLATENVLKQHSEQVEYFPAYEIMLDELRDYRFYAEDMSHPSALAVKYIWERFRDFAIPGSDYERIRMNQKATLQRQHRPNLV